MDLSSEKAILTVSMDSLKIFSTLATLRHSYAKYSGSSLLLNWLARPSSSKSLKLKQYLYLYIGIWYLYFYHYWYL